MSSHRWARWSIESVVVRQVEMVERVVVKVVDIGRQWLR
jgi:hypothetical protein